MSPPASAPQGMPGGAASLAGAKRRFSFNAACNVAGFLTQIVSAFVVTPIVVHGLGNLQYGIWGLIGQTVTSMDLLDFGLGIAVTRFLAHHHARDDRAEMGRMVSTALAFSILPVCIMLLGGAGLAWMAPRWFHTPAALDREVRLAVMLIAAAVAAMVPGSLLGSAVPALSRYDLLTLRNTFWIAVRAVLYWLILRWGYGLVGMAGVTLAVELLALGLGAWLAHRLIPWLRLSWRFVSRRTLRPLLTFSGFAFLLTISTRVIFGCDNIVVGWALGPLAVAFYAVAGGLADQLRQSTKILTTLYSALATQIHALEGSEAMQRLFLTGSRLAFLLVLPGCIGLVLLGPQFLQLWLGAAYRQHSSAILVLLTLTVASFALATSCTQILYGMNRHRYNAAVSLLEAAANLGLSIGLVRTFGAVGVAWGTAVPAVVFEAVVLPLVTVRQIHLSARVYYARAVARPLWVSVPLIAWCWFWRVSGWVNGWFSLVAVAVAGLAIFFLSLRAYGIEPEERDYLRRALDRLPPPAVRLLFGAGAPVATDS